MTFPAGIADRIFHDVLTERYPSGIGAGHNGTAAARTCACQWGTCGNCTNRNRHDRCMTRRSATGRGPEQPAAYLAGVAVWPAKGKRCAWRCPCSCPDPEQQVSSTTPGGRDELSGQMSLFDLAAGVR
ncbi:DUF6248 family natural product biosynthesis protein [Actinoplanes rectilineatus]|uniref:DUF6248 family natural product biosynthesis protein n=1 Tax=Actinoplanes rectilineatus TaxID=113571 RepID=UPI003CCBA935